MDVIDDFVLRAGMLAELPVRPPRANPETTNALGLDPVQLCELLNLPNDEVWRDRRDPYEAERLRILLEAFQWRIWGKSGPIPEVDDEAEGTDGERAPQGPGSSGTHGRESVGEHPYGQSAKKVYNGTSGGQGVPGLFPEKEEHFWRVCLRRYVETRTRICRLKFYDR